MSRKKELPPTIKGISRRKFIGSVAAATVVGATGAAGLINKYFSENSEPQLPVEVITQSPGVDPSVTPEDQIIQAEQSQAIEFSREFILKTAMDYCKYADCTLEPVEIAEKLRIGNSADFSESLNWSSGELVVTLNKPAVDIAISSVSEETKRKVPSVEVRAREATLYHTFSHINSRQETYSSFIPFSIQVPGESDAYNIVAIQDFVFSGINTRSGEHRNFPGIGESFAELVAVSVQLKKDGIVIPFSESAKNGALLLQNIFERTGITPKRFLMYASGRIEFSDMLSEMAKYYDANDVIRAFGVSGFASEGYISYEEGLIGIDTYLAPTPQQTSESIT